MEGASIAAIIKLVAEYGVLGLGWVAWIMTMFYLRAERTRYQALVIHIIQHFTRINIGTDKDQLFGDNGEESKHKNTFAKLIGKE